MYCPKCGKEIVDDAVVCVHCGRAVSNNNQTHNPEHDNSKTGLGVVMGLFLGLIGLVIGLCLYPENTIARKTFMKAWLITFLVCVGVSIVFSIVCYSIIFSVLGTYEPTAAILTSLR